MLYFAFAFSLGFLYVCALFAALEVKRLAVEIPGLSQLFLCDSRVLGMEQEWDLS